MLTENQRARRKEGRKQGSNEEEKEEKGEEGEEEEEFKEKHQKLVTRAAEEREKEKLQSSA